MPKERGLREKGHVESEVRGAFLHFECTLARLLQLAGAVQRLGQPVVGYHPEKGERRRSQGGSV